MVNNTEQDSKTKPTLTNYELQNLRTKITY